MCSFDRSVGCDINYCWIYIETFLKKKKYHQFDLSYGWIYIETFLKKKKYHQFDLSYFWIYIETFGKRKQVLSVRYVSYFRFHD